MNHKLLALIAALTLFTSLIVSCGKAATVTQTSTARFTYTQTVVTISPSFTTTTAIVTTTNQPPTTTSSVGTTYKQLGTPILVSPQDGQVFSNVPRTTTLTWQPVTGATKYTIEILYYQGSITGWSKAVPTTTTNASYTFDFVGAQPGSWRVQALDDSGANLASNFSEWRTFRYTS